MNENRIDFVKWLRVLIYIAIARIINTLIGIPTFIPTAVTAWISRILMALMVFAMFKLAPANDRYKKTGIQLAIVLVLTIATELLNTGAVLTLIAGILSIVAEYQEFYGHSELIEEKGVEVTNPESRTLAEFSENYALTEEGFVFYTQPFQLNNKNANRYTIPVSLNPYRGMLDLG